MCSERRVWRRCWFSALRGGKSDYPAARGEWTGIITPSRPTPNSTGNPWRAPGDRGDCPCNQRVTWSSTRFETSITRKRSDRQPPETKQREARPTSASTTKILVRVISDWNSSSCVATLVWSLLSTTVLRDTTRHVLLLSRDSARSAADSWSDCPWTGGASLPEFDYLELTFHINCIVLSNSHCISTTLDIW